MGINFEMWGVYIVEGIADNNLGIVQNMKITDLTTKTLGYTFTDTGERSRDTFENFNKRWKVIEEIPRFEWGYKFCIDDVVIRSEEYGRQLVNQIKDQVVDKTKEILKK